MAENQLTITFDPCEPTPANGYLVRYREVGSGPYLIWPVNFSGSPAVLHIPGPRGVSYEGFIQGDCGGGNLGLPVPWTAQNHDAGAHSVSDGGSVGESVAPVPCRSYTLSKTVGTPSAHYIDCHGVTQDTLIGTGTVICTNGHGFTISGGGISVDSFTDGDC